MAAAGASGSSARGAEPAGCLSGVRVSGGHREDALGTGTAELDGAGCAGRAGRVGSSTSRGMKPGGLFGAVVAPGALALRRALLPKRAAATATTSARARSRRPIIRILIAGRACLPAAIRRNAATDGSAPGTSVPTRFKVWHERHETNIRPSSEASAAPQCEHDGMPCVLARSARRLPRPRLPRAPLKTRRCRALARAWTEPERGHRRAHHEPQPQTSLPGPDVDPIPQSHRSR